MAQGAGYFSATGGKQSPAVRACRKHEAVSAEEFLPRGKSLVVIGDVPSSLTYHHQTIKF
jgi:hypothetical protein